MIKSIFSLALFTLFILSCNSNSGSVSEFENLVNEGQFEMAYQYTMEHPDEILDNKALLEVGKWYNEQTKFQESGEIFRRLLNQDQNDVICKLLLANNYRETTRYNEALALYSSIANIDSLKLFVLPERARLYSQIQEFQKASVDIELAKAIEPKYFAIPLAEGMLLYAQGEQELALDMLEQAETLNPGVSSEASLYAGVMLMNMGINLDAMHKFTTAIEIGKNINLGYAYINRGICQLNLTDTTFACDDFKAALEYMPEEAQTYRDKYCN